MIVLAFTAIGCCPPSRTETMVYKSSRWKYMRANAHNGATVFHSVYCWKLYSFPGANMPWRGPARTARWGILCIVSSRSGGSAYEAHARKHTYTHTYTHTHTNTHEDQTHIHFIQMKNAQQPGRRSIIHDATINHCHRMNPGPNRLYAVLCAHFAHTWSHTWRANTRTHAHTRTLT